MSGPNSPSARVAAPGRARAVALKYHPGLPAPFILAKADGRAAERLVAIAKEAGVVVLREDSLSAALYPLEVGEYVPEAYFDILARVFAFIQRTEEA